MKFKFKKGNAKFLEMGRVKKVESIELKIEDKVYLPNQDVEIEFGDYLADVNVIYADGTNEVIKQQPVDIDGKNKKVILDMMSYKHRLLNMFINIKFFIAIIITIIATVLFGDLGVVTLFIAVFVVSMGNDYYYKRDGFDKTFRAVIK